MHVDTETNTLHLNYDEIEPLLRSFGNDVWEKYCRDVMAAYEEMICSS